MRSGHQTLLMNLVYISTSNLLIYVIHKMLDDIPKHLSSGFHIREHIYGYACVKIDQKIQSYNNNGEIFGLSGVCHTCHAGHKIRPKRAKKWRFFHGRGPRSHLKNRNPKKSFTTAAIWHFICQPPVRRSLKTL